MTIFKPSSEPYQDQVLEECWSCKTYFPLHLDRCRECTGRRTRTKEVLAKKLLIWRKSQEGRLAYSEMKSSNELLGVFLVALGGFFIFGFIGMMFNYGLLLGLLGGGVFSTWYCRAKIKNYLVKLKKS